LAVLGTITSTSNPRAKDVRSLHKRRVRYRTERYLIEGQRLVAQALALRSELASSFFTEEFARSPQGEPLVAALAEAEAPAYQVTPQVLAHMSDTETPQGVLAVARMPPPDLAAARAADLVVLLDEVRDPGNLGTILRTCVATGVGAVLLTMGCVDAYAPKVVRAGMGAHAALRIVPNLEWAAIGHLVDGMRCVLADIHGEHTPWGLDWTAPTALIVGSEAHGPGPEAQALAEESVRLPMAEDAESLNVAVATAVLLFEAYRQRHAL